MNLFIEVPATSIDWFMALNVAPIAAISAVVMPDCWAIPPKRDIISTIGSAVAALLADNSLMAEPILSSDFSTPMLTSPVS